MLGDPGRRCAHRDAGTGRRGDPPGPERTSVSGFPSAKRRPDIAADPAAAYLADARQPIGLDALAAEAGLNKSTAYRLLRVLQEEGWAQRVPGGYRLGGGFMSLAAQAVPDAPGSRQQ